MTAQATQERLLQVLVGPHISEKSTTATESGNQIVFKVRTDATKADIRRAFEFLFEVKVQSVGVVRVRGKSKRFGAGRGKRSDWKKAYVKLAPGQDIDFVGAD
jgi:large subunit ribosomal protein L23